MFYILYILLPIIKLLPTIGMKPVAYIPIFNEKNELIPDSKKETIMSYMNKQEFSIELSIDYNILLNTFKLINRKYKLNETKCYLKKFKKKTINKVSNQIINFPEIINLNRN